MPEFSGSKAQVVYLSPAPRVATVRDFLSHLAFESQSARFTLELFCCLTLHQVFFFTLPWAALDVSPRWQSFVGWFTACAVVGAFDFLLFVRPLRRLYRVFQLSALGKTESALEALALLHPSAQSWVRLQAPRYYLTRAKVQIQGQNLEAAEVSLMEAAQAAESVDRISVLRSEIAALRGNVERAISEIQLAASFVGENALLLMQQGRLEYHYQKNPRAARQTFERALTVVERNLPQHSRQQELTLQGYHAAALLWTGRAEEGLEALSRVLETLDSSPFLDEEARSHLAALYLERAYYAATHKEPGLAASDSRRAAGLSSSALTLKRLGDVADELSWRHPA